MIGLSRPVRWWCIVVLVSPAVGACGQASQEAGRTGTTPSQEQQTSSEVEPSPQGSAQAADEVGSAQADPSVAERLFLEAEEAREQCSKIELPRFEVQDQLSDEVRGWWHRRQGHAKHRDWEAMLRRMDPADRRAQISSVQFRHWTEARFAPWLARKREALDAARLAYASVFEQKIPRYEVAAAAGIGEALLSVAHDLGRAPIDPSIQDDEELASIYRDALSEAARPYARHAVQAFEHCVFQSRRHAVAREWAQKCQARLDQASP